ncbi:MAG: hypothetical protein H6668_22840 [Ardenticatenaceae bacterium]|nr:hypothetical protein [Ardenticatenaceae bacterium]
MAELEAVINVNWWRGVESVPQLKLHHIQKEGAFGVLSSKKLIIARLSRPLGMG